MRAMVLGTQQTKGAEIAFLRDRLRRHGIDSVFIDLSLHTDTILDGPRKLKVMEATVVRAAADANAGVDDVGVVVAIGGGTGGEMAQRVLRQMPVHLPKILATTMPADPRPVVADRSIILVPTVVDICGLNRQISGILEQVAAMASGLCRAEAPRGQERSVALTALGATEGAVGQLASMLEAQGREVTVVHANGFGGAALCRMIAEQQFEAVVDLTPHELTRMLVGGDHVDMPQRFKAAGEAGLAQIVLPGGLNFIGLGRKSLLPAELLVRPHYAHSESFTHVKLSTAEMRTVATALAAALSASTAAAHLVVPMGGFSHQDRPGGAIEDDNLRAVFLETFQKAASPQVGITTLDAHISAREVADTVAHLLQEIAPHKDLN